MRRIASLKDIAKVSWPLAVTAAAVVALHSGVPNGVSRFIMAIVVAPVLEEVLFRGGVLEVLVRRWPHQSKAMDFPNVISAACFGAAHLATKAPSEAAAVAVSGLIFGAAYLASGKRLWAPILLHSAFNAIFLVMQSGL